MGLNAGDKGHHYPAWIAFLVKGRTGFQPSQRPEPVAENWPPPHMPSFQATYRPAWPIPPATSINRASFPSKNAAVEAVQFKAKPQAPPSTLGAALPDPPNSIPQRAPIPAHLSAAPSSSVHVQQRVSPSPDPTLASRRRSRSPTRAHRSPSRARTPSRRNSCRARAPRRGAQKHRKRTPSTSSSSAPARDRGHAKRNRRRRR